MVSGLLSLTYVAEKNGQDDESVCGADQHDAQVHTEVENLEDLGLGEGQDHDAAELGQRDAGQHLEKSSLHPLKRLHGG